MSNYKVGDLASLMSHSSEKPGRKLQNLFNEHWSKKQGPNAIKNAAKMKIQEKDSSSDIKSKKKEKRKRENATMSSPLNNSTEDSLLYNKDKQQNSFSENSVAKPKKHNSEKNSGSAFIRCAKNKRQKITEQHSVGTINEPSFVEKETLFTELPDQSKKFKNKNKLKPNYLRKDALEKEVDSSPEAVAEESEADLEKIKLENIQDLPFTLFIGNLPVSVNKKMLQKLFSSFGQVKSVRLRGAVSSKPTIPKRVAEIKSKYHKSLNSLTGFVVFKEKKSAKDALSLNGTLIDSHHIVVDFANQAGEKKLYDNDLSIFLGNLPFDVDDDTVRSAFEECGEIQAVRIIRDKNTGIGKGFGYIQFQKIKSKETALTLEDLEINGRKIRIKPVDTGKKDDPKNTMMMIRNNVALKRTKETGNKKSVKKLLKKGKRVHQKKKIARLLGQKFVK